MSLREDLEAAVVESEKAEEGVAVPAQAIGGDIPEQTDVPEQTDGGEEPSEVKEPPAEGTEKATEKKVEAEKEAPAGDKRQRVDRAPESWRNGARANWTQLPLEVRQEIHRREQNINQVMQESSVARQAFLQINQVAQPYAERLQQLGMNPAQALGSLLQADAVLSKSDPKGKAAALAQLMDTYGIDVELLDAAIAERINNAPARQHQEGIRQMVARELAPIRQALGQQQQNTPQVDVSAVEEVQRMSQDPQYPHFASVRGDMADIMDLMTSRGQQISLQDAYNRAVMMNPELAETVISERATQRTTQKLQEVSQAARRASSAAVSVSGAPTGAATREVDPTDLRAMISAGFDAAVGAGRI